MDRRGDKGDGLDESRLGLVEQLTKVFTRLAAGDFSVRIDRTYKRDLEDTLGYLVNVLAEELGRLSEESETTSERLAHGVAEINRLFLELAAGDFSVRVERDESGDAIDVLGFFFNTTAEELQANFRAQARQQQTLRAILDAIGDGVILVGDSGEISESNPILPRLLGREIPPGSKLVDLVVARERDFVTELVEGKRLGVAGRDTLFVGTDGDIVPLVMNGTRLPEGGEPGGLVLSLRDERELRHARMQLQAADRMATMGTLAAGVAHEINNPMSFLISNLEFVLEELEALGSDRPIPPELFAEIVDALTAAKDGSDRVTQIVRDLKSISRVDKESLSVVKIQSIMDASVSMLRNEIRDRARVEKDYTDLPAVKINEARVVQICLNLIQNAAQSIPKGNADDNTIRLFAAIEPRGELQIAVSDTGCGIPTERIDSIFDAFYTSKEDGVGTGLGLSICKRLVDGMGGHIEVQSEVGRGTTFRVFLPTEMA